jgi:hypothetical protein
VDVEIERPEVRQVGRRREPDLTPEVQPVERLAQVDLQGGRRLARHPPRVERPVHERQVRLVVILSFQVAEVVELQRPSGEVLPGVPQPVRAAVLADVERSARRERARFDVLAVGLDALGAILDGAADGRTARGPEGLRCLEAVGRGREQPDLCVARQLALDARDVEHGPGIETAPHERTVHLSHVYVVGTGQRRD